MCITTTPARRLFRDRDHRRIAKAGDVVDDDSTRFETGAGDVRLHGVDGDGDRRPPGDLRYHRHNPAQFFFERNRFREGSSRFAADVENVRPLLHEGERRARWRRRRRATYRRRRNYPA